MTLTLGIVSAKGNVIDEVETLIKDSDAALYKGKDQGRNCVVSSVLGFPEEKQ